MMGEIYAVIEWLFILYFIGVNSGYLLLNVLSIFIIRKTMEESVLKTLPHTYDEYYPPVSIIVPAYNEEETIVSSVQSLLQLSYAEYEVIVVNDGSSDRTLERLIREFSLIPFPEAYRQRVSCKPVVTIYRSGVHSQKLKVIDKVNGGKADALNAGINSAQYPLFCGVDADSILPHDSLGRVVEPLILDSTAVASGGTIRIANGCEIRDGNFVKSGLPRNPLALFQIVEYLRAFLFGRVGWVPLNSLMIISGAFGVFKKELVISVGGYRTDTVGEDMELVIRLHRYMRKNRKPYRITFVPDPICWTEAPEDMSTLRKQRMRWQRGLAESLSMNRGLLFSRNSGFLGWFAFPFMVVFEMFQPLVSTAGYLFTLIAALKGWVSHDAVVVFLFVSVVFGMLLSVTSLLLEELSFRIYKKPKEVAGLFLMSIMENVGYRQLNDLWRLTGLLTWLVGSKAKWGVMKRTASWKKE